MAGKKLLLVPGIGDIHWICLKLQSWLYNKGWDYSPPDVWIWDIDGRPRALEYLYYVSWLNPKGYMHQELVGEAEKIWDRIYRKPGSPDYVEGCHTEIFNSFDAVIGLNGNMRNGVPFSQLLEEAEINHNYGPTPFPDYCGRAELEKGPYFIVAFSDFGAFKHHWCCVFTPQVIKNLLRYVRTFFPGHRFIFTGCSWDLEFTRQIMEDSRDSLRVGETTLMEHLSLLQKSSGFLGFSAGSAMMAQHLGVPTVVWWSRAYFPKHDRRGWETPYQKYNHLVLDVEAYLEKETPRQVAEFLRWRKKQ